MSIIDLDDAISQLTVTVNNSDTDMADLTLHIFTRKNVPLALAETDYPALFPDPREYWKEQDTTPGVFDNVTGREFSVTGAVYDLALAPVGAIRGPWEAYDNAINLTLALKELIRGIDLPMTKISGISISGVIPMKDASDNSFWGCKVGIAMQEYIQELN
jgi:hypothetical protein